MRFLVSSTAGLLLMILVLQLCTHDVNGFWSRRRRSSRRRHTYRRPAPPSIHTYRVRRDDTGVCVYKGYKPGGGVPNIEPIKSPVCKGFGNSLGFISGIIGKSAAAGRALSTAATLIENTAKVAKVLSAGFGVFAVAFNVVASFSKPTPNDILKKVDGAFKELTKDMNDRLKKMEGYVDAKVIHLEQGLVKNEFAALQRFLTNCIHETTEASVRRCQRNSVRDIDAAWPKFERLKAQFQRNEKNIALFDVRRLEASLIPFRDYASLHLFALQLLVNAYKDDEDTDEKNNRLKLYFGQIKERGDMYYKYAHWAYDRIYMAQVGKHYHGNSPKDQYMMDKNVDHLREGKFWLVKGKNTEDRIKVKPTCLAGDDQADINKCQFYFHMRVDGKVPERYPARQSKQGSSTGALREFAQHDAREACKKYLGALKHDLTTFWRTELISLADNTWKKVADKAAADAKKVDSGAFKSNKKPAEVGDLMGLLSGKGLSCHVSCNYDDDKNKHHHHLHHHDDSPVASWTALGDAPAVNDESNEVVNEESDEASALTEVPSRIKGEAVEVPIIESLADPSSRDASSEDKRSKAQEARHLFGILQDATSGKELICKVHC